MQETLTFPSLGSPLSFAFPHAYFDQSEKSSTASTPFVSAPSSPGRIGAAGFYFSAPASPNWSYRTSSTMQSTMQEALQESSMQDAFYPRRDYTSAIPFSWEEEEEEEEPPRSEAMVKEEPATSFFLSGGSDFEFSARFSVLEDPAMSPTPMSSANELFFNGQIRPLGPPVPSEQLSCERHGMSEEVLQNERNFATRNSVGYSSSLSAPQSPRSPYKSGRNSVVKGALGGISGPVNQVFDLTMEEEQMGKHENGSGHRRTRSFSPLRILNWDDHSSKSSSHGDVLSRDSSVDDKEPREDSRRSSSKAFKRWSLKDLLHRKSGREAESSSNASSRRSSTSMEASSREKQSTRGSSSSQSSINLAQRASSSSSGPVNGAALRMKASRRPTRGSVSPHELHYTMQRAQTEELRKKTFLPYRQGLLGCLGFTSRSYRAVSTISKSLQPVSG